MEEKTNYHFSFSLNEGVVEVVITGELTKYSIDTLHAEVISIVIEKNAKAVLCDVRDAKGPQDIVEAYFRVRSFPANIKILPSAIVDRQGNWDFKSYYETTAANAGQSVKWFTDIEEARAWIESKLNK